MRLRCRAAQARTDQAVSRDVRPPDPFLLAQRGNTEMSRAASKQCGFVAAARCPVSPALSGAPCQFAGQRLPVVGRRPAAAGRPASVEHGSVRSSACPGEVFGVAPARSAALALACVAAVRRSRSAKLRRYGSEGILGLSFGWLTSVGPGAARERADRSARERGQLR
jgi:hypothetical protein